MVIIDRVINTLLGRLTLDPAGMHCPSWDDAFVSSLSFWLQPHGMLSFCLCVCHVCSRDNSKSCRRMLMNFFGRVGCATSNSGLEFLW